MSKWVNDEVKKQKGNKTPEEYLTHLQAEAYCRLRDLAGVDGTAKDFPEIIAAQERSIQEKMRRANMLAVGVKPKQTKNKQYYEKTKKKGQRNMERLTLLK